MRVLIVGAGICGLSMAILLERLCIEVDIVEQLASLNLSGAGIALPSNAIDAMEFFNLKDDLISISHKINSIISSEPNGLTLSKKSLKNYFSNDQHPFISILRKHLVKLLFAQVKQK